jgi:hypothetical protein
LPNEQAVLGGFDWGARVEIVDLESLTGGSVHTVWPDNAVIVLV